MMSAARCRSGPNGLVRPSSWRSRMARSPAWCALDVTLRVVSDHPDHRLADDRSCVGVGPGVRLLVAPCPGVDDLVHRSLSGSKQPTASLTYCRPGAAAGANARASDLNPA